MNEAVEQMLAKYNPKSTEDYTNALKEILQEIILLGLDRNGFFEKAAFYGGTALRIMHGLDRFSEDLDFTSSAPEVVAVVKVGLGGLNDVLTTPSQSHGRDGDRAIGRAKKARERVREALAKAEKGETP